MLDANLKALAEYPVRHVGCLFQGIGGILSDPVAYISRYFKGGNLKALNEYPVRYVGCLFQGIERICSYLVPYFSKHFKDGNFKLLTESVGSSIWKIQKK